jgi:hypothetical protein
VLVLSALVLRLREALTGGWRKPPDENGSLPTPPEDYQTGESIWDDPVLWMLMMH